MVGKTVPGDLGSITRHSQTRKQGRWTPDYCPRDRQLQRPSSLSDELSDKDTKNRFGRARLWRPKSHDIGSEVIWKGCLAFCVSATGQTTVKEQKIFGLHYRVSTGWYKIWLILQIHLFLCQGYCHYPCKWSCTLERLNRRCDLRDLEQDCQHTSRFCPEENSK